MSEMPMRYVERTFTDIRQGDRIRFRGAEAVVSSAVAAHWHAIINLRGDSGYWDTIPKKWTGVRFRLEGRDKLYELPAETSVEILLTDAEIEMLDRMGWANRVAVLTSAVRELLS